MDKKPSKREMKRIEYQAKVETLTDRELENRIAEYEAFPLKNIFQRVIDYFSSNVPDKEYYQLLKHELAVRNEREKPRWYARERIFEKVTSNGDPVGSLTLVEKVEAGSLSYAAQEHWHLSL